MFITECLPPSAYKSAGGNFHNPFSESKIVVMKQPKIISNIPRGQKIVLMESDRNYTVLYLENGRKLLSGYCLKTHENIADNQSFMRLNRSEMINKLFIKLVNIEEASLTLSNGRKVSISRRRMKAFQAWI